MFSNPDPKPIEPKPIHTNVPGNNPADQRGGGKDRHIPEKAGSRPKL